MVTTMDRYGADWRIVEAGWRRPALGTAHPVPDLLSRLELGPVDQGVLSDQLLPAFTVVDESQQPVGSIVDGDAVVMFNFRGDRAISCRKPSRRDQRSTSSIASAGSGRLLRRDGVVRR